MKFKVGSQTVDCSRVFDSKKPGDQEIADLKLMFANLEIGSSSIPEVIEKCLSFESHPWLELALCLCNVRYSTEKRVNDMTMIDYLEALFCKPEDLDTTVRTHPLKSINAFLNYSDNEFRPILSDLLQYIEKIASNYFQIGSSWAKYDEVCQALSPSAEDKWVAFSIVGNCVELGIPLLESLELAGESTTHPWMRMFFSIASTQERIGVGKCLSQGIADGISNFLRHRLKKYRELDISGNVGKSTFEYFLPNIIPHFAYELSLLDAGKFIGQLDDVSLMIAKHYKTPNSKPWSKDLSEIFSLLALYQESGLSILKSLMLIQTTIQNTKLSSDLQKVIDKIESGSTLVEACAESNSEFALPSVVAFLKCGERAEKAGGLEKVLAYMTAK